MGIAHRLVGLDATRLDEERHGIDPESGYTQCQPESHDFQDFLPHDRVGGIEVRLELVEAVHVPGLGRPVIGPGGLLHARKNYPLGNVVRFFVAPDVPVAVGRIRIGTRGLKPGMLIGCVIDHQIDDDPHAAIPGGLHEFDEIAQRAQCRVDTVVVRDVVAIVLAG